MALLKPRTMSRFNLEPGGPRFPFAGLVRTRFLQRFGLPSQECMPQPPVAWLAPEAGALPPTSLRQGLLEPLYVPPPEWVVPFPLFVL